MCTERRIRGWLKLLIPISLGFLVLWLFTRMAPPGRALAQEPVFKFRFERSLEGEVLGAAGRAKLGQGASFVPSIEGFGIQTRPNHDGVTLPVTRAMLPRAGTFVLWFRPDERIGPDAEEGSIKLAEGAGLRIQLERRRNLVALDVRVESDTAEGLEGDALFSHFRKDAWYHVALVWDLSKKQMELYLNGVLQQDLRPRIVPAETSSERRQSLALGESVVPLSIDSPALYQEVLAPDDITSLSGKTQMPQLNGEGRTVFDGSIDLSQYKLELIHEADFRKPLKVQHELELVQNGVRREPSPETKWVLEGDGRAWTEDGSLFVETTGERNAGHLVLWSTRVFPDDVLIEWEIQPEDVASGLAILFFATRPVEQPDRSIFDKDLPLRDGLFTRYHSGALIGYHVSYWSGGRRTVNLRKNAGFLLATCGDDVVTRTGDIPHRVRVLKAGRRIEVEADGQLALRYRDNSPEQLVWNDGYIGLRQMGDTRRMRYGSFRVYRLKPATE